MIYDPDIIQENERGPDGELLVCVFQPYFRMTDGLAAFSYAQFAVSTSIIVLTLVFWYRNRNHPYLLYRNFYLTCLLGVACFVNVVNQSFNRATFPDFRDSNFTDWDGLHSCEVETFLTNLTIPLALVVLGVRLYRWWLNVKYNEKLSEFFQEKNRTNQVKTNGASTALESATVTSSSLEQLRKMRRQKGFKTLFLISAVGCVLSCIYSFATAYLNCPISGSCTIYDSDNSESITSLLLNALPTLGYLILVYFVQKAKRNYPDPMNLLAEMILGLSLPLLLVVIYVLLRLPDVFDLIDSEKPYNFSYGIVTDLAILTAFIILATLPTVQSYKKQQTNAAQDISLTDILKTKTGEGLLRNHLIFEFSIDNLNFYLTATRWREGLTDNIISEKDRKAAINIFRRWIKPGSPFEVNLSYSTVQQVRKSIDKGDIDVLLFDEAIEDIFTLMSTDSLPRFKKSVYFHDFIGQEVDENAPRPSTIFEL
eukprot:augustus_masked-scaffold_12-processed-gene-5.2-mRNA-1 protein AED:1.00 eAED:1.00 QI:0/-1/0/0/-1/1/1/0/481